MYFSLRALIAANVNGVWSFGAAIIGTNSMLGGRMRVYCGSIPQL